MPQHVRVVLVLCVCLSIAAAAPAFAQAQAAAPKPVDVSFDTEDGWTIHATYYGPPGTLRPAPALVVLSEPDWVPRNIGRNISEGVTAAGMAALAIDMRGTAGSVGKKDYQVFSPEERDGLQLDVRAAVKFLSAQKGVDPKRIAIFAPNVTAEYAIREAAANAAQIKALVLSSAALTDTGRERLKFLKDLPVLAIASDEDARPLQARASEPFFLSEARGSRLMFTMDRGGSIFNRPGGTIERVRGWLQENLIGLGLETEVTFKTEDGVPLIGTLYTPHGLRPGERVAGVVFVHGANHDATTWYHMANEVVKKGLAALIFDQRGYRKSVWDLSKTTLTRAVINERDIRAGINFMASQPVVDPNRLGLVTATSRGGPAIAAAHGDARIRTIVGLSFYGADENTARYIANMDIPFFMIADTNDVNADGGSLAQGTRDVYLASKNKASELLMYDDGGRGSNMLKFKPELIGMIARWFEEKLARNAAVSSRDQD